MTNYNWIPDPTLRRFMHSHDPNHTVMIDNYKFRINPTDFKMHRQRVQSSAVTHEGNGRFSYTNKIPVLTFTGHTGLSGLDGIQSMESHFRLLENNRERLIRFMYPNRFGNKVMWVYVNTFDDTMSDAMHLNYGYTFELEVWPKTRPASFHKVIGPGVQIGLPVGG